MFSLAPHPSVFVAQDLKHHVDLPRQRASASIRPTGSDETASATEEAQDPISDKQTERNP
jgi:hypothetical protein